MLVVTAAGTTTYELVAVGSAAASRRGLPRRTPVDRLAGGGAEERWELSVSVDAAARGRGSGGAVLGAGCRALAAATGAAAVLVARIRPETAASQALFSRAGFVPVGDAGGGLRWWERPLQDPAAG